MCVGSWAGVIYFRYAVLMSPNKDKTVVHCGDPALSIVVMFGVSKRLSSCSLSLGAFIVCDPLQFVVSCTIKF